MQRYTSLSLCFYSFVGQFSNQMYSNSERYDFINKSLFYSSDGLTVIESASESTSNSNFYQIRFIIVEEDVHIDEMQNAMPIRRTATSSLFQPFVTSSVVMENESFNSNFTPVDEGENFSRATFSLFSQQLLSPMWNEKEEEKQHPVNNEMTNAESVNEINDINDINDQIVKTLDPEDTSQFLEKQLPDYFISFSTLLTKEDYFQYVEHNDLNGIITVFIHSILFYLLVYSSTNSFHSL